MGFLKFVVRIFWNDEENRLRALCRLGVHTVILLIFISAFTVGLLFIPVIFDILGGVNLQSVLSGEGPMWFMDAPWIGTVIIPAATTGGVLLTTFLSGRWIDRRKFKKFGLVFTHQWWIDFAFGLGLGALLMGLIFLFGLITGNISVTGFFESFSQDVSFLSGLIQSLIFFIFVGIYEEVLSRGYHLVNLAEGFNIKVIGKRWALILALLVSSLVFGLLHMGNPNATWVSTLNISLAGVFLGLGMVLTGSLAIPIGLHITWNLFQGNVFGFPVSGINTGATVIVTESIGPSWLMGGLFGPEAGALGLAAMVIGCLLTIWWVGRKGAVSLREELAEYHAPPITEEE